ncbi:hypothetical protein C0991_003030 [Blastosporella zonata]|nr:hypothetical protein C0991_003030 [Blastosporella zonata]
MNNLPLLATAVAVSSLYVVSELYKAWVDRRLISKIPTIGESGILSSYRGSRKFLFNSREMIQEGYAKYRGHAFKIAGISKWTVFISGNQMIDDLRKAPDDHISFTEAAAESIQTIYTMGPEIHFDQYHVDVVKSSLTRSLVERFPDVQDEIAAAFQDFVPATENWTPVLALPTIMKITSRASNRLFVGLPLCRDPDYRDLNIEFTVDVIKASRTINLYPNFLKSLAGRYFTNIEPQIERAMNHLRPIIQDRLDKDAEYGNDWSERPAFTQILFDLAAYPAFVPALREEVESVINEDGFSKVSLHKMVKLDSFIKESQRVGGNGAVNMMRKVLKDFTFSDGTVVPKGNTIAITSFSMHHDEDNYNDASVFDGFRFSKMREQQAEGFSKHQMVALNHDYIVFGHGKHACPGRFFAVNELKGLLSYVLLNYDVSFENHGPRPADTWFGLSVAPDPEVSVMFRKRRS